MISVSEPVRSYCHNCMQGSIVIMVRIRGNEYGILLCQQCVESLLERFECVGSSHEARPVLRAYTVSERKL